MFDSEKNSLFENGDDFGVQEYRDDINVLINLNSVTVKHIVKNAKIVDSQQGDFFGIKTKIYNDNPELINICINSNNSENKKLIEEGYTGRGEIRFNCYATYNTEVSNKDIIVFITDYSYGIKTGDKFKIEMKETGPWMGQYSYKNFDIVQIAA